MTSSWSTAAFVYARLDSRRLPGKALRHLGDERLIETVCRRASAAAVDLVALLTTERPVDDPLAEFCEALGYRVFRGDAFDLVKRTLDALDHFGSQRFVRVNGDSPFVEPTLIDLGLHQMERAEFVSNLFVRTFPYGIAVECVDAGAYRALAPYAKQDDLEHVTRHLYRDIDRDGLKSIGMRDAARIGASNRLVVDTEDDLRRLRSRFCGQSIGAMSYWDFLATRSPQVVLEHV